MPNKDLWNLPDEELTIHEGIVHIWLVDIEKEACNHEYLSGLLSNNELERSKRFIFDKDKKRFIITHGILRLILSRYIHLDSKTIYFAREKKGKPVIKNPENNDIRFNLSHSGKYIIYALTRGREVGIDIQYMKDMPDSDRIVKRFFSNKEINEYFELPAAIRKRAFFTCWTRKEALIKAIGEGLNMPLNSFSVSPNPGIKSKIEIHDGRFSGRQWSLEDVRLNDMNYVSSIAVEGRGFKIIYWNWE